MCINSATDRRGFVLEHRCTKFSEITQNNGPVQDHSRLPILVPVKSSYTTSYLWLILTYLLPYTVSKLWLIIGQIFASERGVPHFNALTGVIPCQYRHKWYIAKTRFFGLHFCCRKYWCSFNHFYVKSAPKATEFGKIMQQLGLLHRSRSSKVTDFGTNRKLICDFLLVINSNLAPILHSFRDIAFNRSKVAIFGYPFVFNSHDRGVPRDDLRKILPGRQQMADVPNGVEKLWKISIAWVGCTSVTDRQTTYSERGSHSLKIRVQKDAVTVQHLYWVLLLSQPSCYRKYLRNL